MFVNYTQPINCNYSIIFITKQKHKFRILDQDTLSYVPDCQNMISDMVEDINKVKMGFFGRLLNFSCIFLIIYIVLIIVLIITGNAKFFYIPLIFLILFFISICTGSCYRQNYFKKLQKIVFEYERKLNGKYVIQSTFNQHAYGRRRAYYIAQNIKLIPTQGNQIFVMGQPNYMVNEGFGQIYMQQTYQNNQQQQNQMDGQTQNFQYVNVRVPDIPIQSNSQQQNQQNFPIYQVDLQNLQENKESAKKK